MGGGGFQGAHRDEVPVRPAQQGINAKSDWATAIFPVFQETLTYVARPAGTSEVEARVAREDDGLTMAVHDPTGSIW